MLGNGDGRPHLGVARVIGRGWQGLVANLLLSYLLLAVAVLVAANVARGVARSGLANGATYAIGAGLLVVALVFAFSAFLSATVELTRSICTRESIRPWTPFWRGTHRVLAVAWGLLVLAPRMLLVALAATVLFVLSVLTVPVGLVIGLVWLVRPSWRRSWMRWPMLAAVPFGALAYPAVRWALWLPFVVVDRRRGRDALRASREMVRSQWARTARPLAFLTAITAVGCGGVVALSESGAGKDVVGVASLIVGAVFVIGCTTAVTLLHDDYVGPTPRRPAPQKFGWRPGRAPSPVVAGTVAFALIAPSFWLLQSPPASAASSTGSFVVNSLSDNLAPDLSTECLTPSATCTLRAAVAQVQAAPVAGATITFSVSGTIDLLGTLNVGASVVIDGTGQRVALRNTTGGTAVVLSSVAAGGGEAPPGNFTFANLTVLGTPAGDASGLAVGSANVTISNATFRDLNSSQPGSAIYNNGHLTVVNSTFVNDVGLGPDGGALASAGTLTVNNSTFVDNQGGGVGALFSTTATVTNSLFRDGMGGFNCPPSATVSGNVSNDGSCATPGDAARTNLSSASFALGDFSDHGGSVDTVSILPTSVAIGAADATLCPTTDARGQPRPIPPSPCDSGSYQASDATTTTLTAAQNPAPFGSPVQLTATVQHPTVTPTGSVQLSGTPSGTMTASLDGSGKAVFSVDGFTVGLHHLTATYVPNGPLSASSGGLDLTIGKQATTVALTVDPPGGVSASGAPITLTVNVHNAADANGAVPTGTVDFQSDGTSVGTGTLSAGVATLPNVVLASGPHSLTAVYGGDAGFDGNTSPAVSQAVQSSTSVVLTAPSSSIYGATFNVSAAVAATVSGLPDATGNVTFTATTTDASASYSLGFAAVSSGTAATTSSVIPAGAYNLHASYPGDAYHAAAGSADVAHTVAAAATTTGLTGPSSTTTVGQAAPFTATVSPTGTPAVPTGSVVFAVDGVDAATVALTGGSATYAPTDLHASSSAHSVVARYVPADGNFVASTSAAVLQTVTAIGTSTALTAPSSSVAGQSVSLTAVVTPAPPSTAVPSGTVTFVANGVTVGTAPLVGGTATATVTNLPVGTDSLTAIYGGSGDLFGSTSPTATDVVSKAATAVAIGSSLPSPVYGQAVSLTATVTVTAPGSGTPTGAVVFRDGTTVLGTAAVTGGVATLPATVLNAGDRALTADYAGDGNLLPGHGALTLTVAKATPVVAITSVSPEPSRFGSPVTITATVVSPTGSAPGGEVQFTWGGSQVVGQVPVVNGVATLVTSDLFIARTIIEANYLGDANHNAAFSPRATDADLTFHTVERALFGVTVSVAKTPTVFGDLVTVNADVAPIGGRIPSGAVRIRIQNVGFAPPTNFDANGHASADFTGVPPGNPQVFVDVDADPWFEASLGNTYSGLVVDPGDAAVALTAGPIGTPGSPTTLTATVTPAAAFGIGSVRFAENGNELGVASVDGTGKATVNVSFPTAGPHVVSALYDGGLGFFRPAVSAPLTVDVPGIPLNLSVPATGAAYGDPATVDVTLFNVGITSPLPTGILRVKEAGQTLGLASVVANADPGFVFAHASIPVGQLEPGLHQLVVSYSGDSLFGAVSAATSISVGPRALPLTLDPPFPNPATAGEPEHLAAHLVVPPGLADPKGTITVGDGVNNCAVPLVNGVRGGGCTAIFPRGGTSQLLARYTGDPHYAAANSGVLDLPVNKGRAFVNLTTTHHNLPFGGQAWTDTEPVTVSWNVLGGATAVPTGPVQIWTNEGQQFCPSGVTGSCDIHFSTSTDGGWIEARFLGDDAFDPAVGRQDAPVAGCYLVGVLSPGTVVTPPNCGTNRYIAGSQVALAATPPPGYTLAGFNEGPTEPTLEQSPVWVFRNRFMEARFAPICFTLSASMNPYNLPRIPPDPGPNCDDLQAPDFSTPNLSVIRANEVANGAMRYRVGTKVKLPATNILLNVPPNGLLASIGWTGTGVGPDSSVTMDQDRSVLGRLALPCHSLAVDGPPGATVKLGLSTLDTSKSAFLAFNTGGVCTRPDGSTGYLPGTTVRVTMTAPQNGWFDHWGPVESAAGHHAPTGMTAVSAKPAGATDFASTSVVMPNYDAAMSGFADAVFCYQLHVHIQDAVDANHLADGSKPATVATSPGGTCPGWWLDQNSIFGADRTTWYQAGSQVTLTADSSLRHGYVDQFSDPKQIFFRGWSGGVTGDGLVQTVTMNNFVDVTASWYVAAACSKIILRTTPSGSGDAVMGDLGTECPTFQSGFANVPPTPQAPLGWPLLLAAKPNGSLQPIWHLEGPSVSNTQACQARNQYIADTRAAAAAKGQSQAQADRILMDQGYLPGAVLARIQDEAKWRFDQGYTQDQIIADLKTLGLLDANGQPVPDNLRPNPCDSTQRDIVLPAGQRTISMTVDGDLVATAWFCQAVAPTVTVIDVDGNRSTATGAQLAKFEPLFRSSDASINCPTSGWFLPNTTAVLGTTGVNGYSIDGWTLDGVAKPAGSLSVPITDGPAHAVGLTVRLQCRTLTVSAPFDYTANPAPNCPGVDASRHLYLQGTKVMVGAGLDSNHVFDGWSTGGSYNPTLITMSDNVNMTANFHQKSVGEQIMDNVIDPAITALGVGAKKVVGGIAYATKVVGQALIEDTILTGLSLIGTGLNLGLGLVGVQGQVLDGIVLGLQTPSNVFDASFAGFDCVEQWAWGSSVPTLNDAEDLAKTAVVGAAEQQVQGVTVSDVLAQAQALTAKVTAGDPAAMSEAYVAASGTPAAAMVLALALDMQQHPDVWQARATDLGNYALQFLQTNFGKSFTWETSAGDAWTTGGDAFLQCMGNNGQAMAGK